MKDIDNKEITEGVKRSGSLNKRIVRATVIPIGPMSSVKKSLDDKDAKSKEIPEDPWEKLVAEGLALDSPFDLLILAMLHENNTELRQCLDAMVTNIDGYGYRFVTRRKIEEIETDPKLIASVRKERVRLENFFSYACLKDSFTAFRKKIRMDYESTGNLWFEVLRGIKGDIQGFNHIPAYQMRLGVLDRELTHVDMPVLELQEDGSVIAKTIKVWMRFRQHVQQRSLVSKNMVMSSAYSTRWFKEFGDPRTFDNEIGAIVSQEDARKMPESRKANEIVHMGLYSPRSPYGLPRHIGNLLDIYGDRAAGEINYITFKSNNIPSMAVLVSDGQLTDGSIQRITEFAESQIQGSDNMSKFLVIEAESVEGDGEETGHVKLDIQPLTKDQHTDQLFQEYSKNIQDRIRRAFRIPPILVGRCHSIDTEYLTQNGWKLYDNVSDDNLLATVNLDSGLVEYQNFTNRYKYSDQVEMISIKNRGLDALVTLNHNMWTRPTTASLRKDKEWEFVEAGQLDKFVGCMNGCVELPVSAWWEGKEEKEFEIPGGWRLNGWDPDKESKNITRDVKRYNQALDKYQPRNVSMDLFLKFLGYFISEGSTTEIRGPITISQKRGLIADSIRQCLNDLEFEICEVESREDELNFSFSHLGLWEWLRENCGTGSRIKRIPNFVLDLSPRQMNILLESLNDGDGSRDPRGSEGSFSYITTSKTLNDQLHELCLKCGIALTTRKVIPVEKNWSEKWASYGTVKHRHLLQVNSVQYERVKYSGDVACFTVPNGVLVTRRNGRVLISGNSDDYSKSTADTSRRLADEQVFAPERDEFDMYINRIVFPEMGIVHHKFKSNSPNTTDNTELVSILGGAEKTGGMTPRIARTMLEDILGIELPEFPNDFPVDIPFSMTMAEAVKNLAQPNEPGQQITALKTIEMLTGSDMPVDDMDGDLLDRFMRIGKRVEKRWLDEFNS